jgi:hypothetical protein
MRSRVAAGSDAVKARAVLVTSTAPTTAAHARSYNGRRALVAELVDAQG